MFNKNNYQIDIIDKNIICYIHFANYDFDKIKIAFDIINNLSHILSNVNISNDLCISKEDLKEINQEYMLFDNKRQEIKNYIRDSQTKLLKRLDECKFNKLKNYLLSKSFYNKEPGIHTCNLCNVYTSNTLKGMAAHKKGCIKKIHPI